MEMRFSKSNDALEQKTVEMPVNLACAHCAGQIARGNVKPGCPAWWVENFCIPEVSAL